MNEIEIATRMMPLWFEVFLGVAGAFGGLELLKWFASLDIFRRKVKAEAQTQEAQAKQEAITAEQQQNALVHQQLEMSSQMLAQMKQHNAYLGEQLATYQQEKLEDRKLKSEYRYRISELERSVAGMKAVFGREVAKKKDAELHYCANEKCTIRIPKMGEYSTETPSVEVAGGKPSDNN